MAKETQIFEAADESIGSWEKANNTLKNSLKGKFKSDLEIFYLAEGYIDKIENSIDEMSEFSTKECTAFKNYVDQNRPAAEVPEEDEVNPAGTGGVPDGESSHGKDDDKQGKKVKPDNGSGEKKADDSYTVQAQNLYNMVRDESFYTSKPLSDVNLLILTNHQFISQVFPKSHFDEYAFRYLIETQNDCYII